MASQLKLARIERNGRRISGQRCLPEQTGDGENNHKLFQRSHGKTLKIWFHLATENMTRLNAEAAICQRSVL
jgi:hypothetical protein